MSGPLRLSPDVVMSPDEAEVVGECHLLTCTEQPVRRRAG
jgi:hypothetical protein